MKRHSMVRTTQSYSNARHGCALLILALTFFSSFAFSQQYADPALHQSVLRGMEFLLSQEYRQADSVFQKVAQRYPSDPSGYIYQAAVLQTQAMDEMMPVQRPKFDSLIEIGKREAGRLSSPWREYFLGAADGYDASADADIGNWFSGMKKGMSSGAELEKVLAADSSFADAYGGVGTYYYWRSRKTSWVPFVKDKRQRGIEMLKFGAEHSVYHRYSTISALISVLLDAEEYGQALLWSRKGLQRFPKNRVFLWGAATAFDRAGHSREAVHAYERLLASILSLHGPHPYNEVVCRLNLAKCLLALGDSARADEQLGFVLRYSSSWFPSYLTDRVKDKFEQAKQLHAHIGSGRM
jgi:tetratricopeptide (TPR) repeat protein